jgi:hypothetical protein
MENCQTADDIKAATIKILRAHGLYDRFQEAEDFHARIMKPPFHPLTIERHGRQVIVAHYREQGDGMVPDPDMEFWISRDSAWEPVAAIFASGDFRTCMDGPLDVDEEERAQLVSLASAWSRELLAQGFDSGEVCELWGTNL